MKKTVCLLLLVGMLCGCSAAQTFETVNDELISPVMAPMGEVQLSLPAHAAAPVINGEDGGKLYLCDGYSLTVQTLQGGNLDASVRSVCGFGMDLLTVMQTKSGDVDRFEWVWTAVGEGEDQLGRAVLLDDGSYHYCVCVMADAEMAGSLQAEWDGIFSTLSLTA